MAKSEISKTRGVANKTLHLALQILKEHGSEMRGQDVIIEIEKRAGFDSWEKELYPKSGNPHWRSIFHFYSIGLIKAGLLVKKKGVWYLTPEGEKSLTKTPIELVTFVNVAYRDWRAANPKETGDISNKEDEVSVNEEIAEKQLLLSFENIEVKATEIIKEYISKKNPYEFQDLCAGLLRGMGYYTPFVAPRGKDGGIDIIAYRDPLGTSTPRIKIQVKHRADTSANAKELRELIGLLQRDGDVGIFISSSGFTPDARQHARTAHVHLELIDIDRFISLWQDFYPKLTDEDKRLLPLQPVYFLSLDE